jgi:hypothetical protein
LCLPVQAARATNKSYSTIFVSYDSLFINDLIWCFQIILLIRLIDGCRQNQSEEETDSICQLNINQKAIAFVRIKIKFCACRINVFSSNIEIHNIV